MSNCRACNAPIRWVNSAATGKPMPLDVQPRTDGNVKIVGRSGYVLGSDEARDQAKAEGVDLYLSHFATCPQAGRFR